MASRLNHVYGDFVSANFGILSSGYELGCALVERVVITHVVYDILLAEIVYFLSAEKVRINC